MKNEKKRRNNIIGDMTFITIQQLKKMNMALRFTKIKCQTSGKSRFFVDFFLQTGVVEEIIILTFAAGSK